jgi:predicted Fe-Mo cluster-binding NifX family protein
MFIRQEEPMAWRIAVTSADGGLINQHFGHARWVFVYDLNREGKGVLIERRDISQTCGCGSGNHGEKVWPDTLAAVRDCIALITAKIGLMPRKRLELAGISVFEEPAVISEALSKLAAYYVKTKKVET